MGFNACTLPVTLHPASGGMRYFESTEHEHQRRRIDHADCNWAMPHLSGSWGTVWYPGGGTGGRWGTGRRTQLTHPLWGRSRSRGGGVGRVQDICELELWRVKVHSHVKVCTFLWSLPYRSCKWTRTSSLVAMEPIVDILSQTPKQMQTLRESGRGWLASWCEGCNSYSRPLQRRDHRRQGKEMERRHRDRCAVCVP